MPEPAAKRRRIPEYQRKRSSQSCDFCRKRRCRCIRVPGAAAGEGCQACQHRKKPCTWTAPTKTRFYGCVEDLSDRYRCMDAIIRATYPNDTIDTTEDLVNLGERLGCNMSDILTLPQVPYDELVKDSSHDHTVPANNDVNSGLQSWRASQERELNADAGSGRVSDSTAARLFHDASGNEHYIGPSGSLTFFAELRDLVTSFERNGQYTPASSSNFALDNVAKALEPVGEENQSDDDANDNDLSNYNIASPTSILSTASHKTDGFGQNDLDDILKALPPREVMETLIMSYFDRVHADFPLFHRATFQDEYETFVLRARNATLRAQASGSTSEKLQDHAFQRPDWGWLASLNMILFFGSLSDPKTTLSKQMEIRRSCISTSYSLLPHITTRCIMSNVQALLLLSLYFHNNNDRNAAWTVVGTATRIAFAIGLHQTGLDSLFRPIQREMRKRVWCTLFTFEQFLCSSLGRPSGIGDPGVEIRVPLDGLLDDGNGLGLAFAEESLKLSRILEVARQIEDIRPRSPLHPTPRRTQNKTSRLTRNRSGQGASIATRETVLEDLNNWKSGLPMHLQFLSITSRSNNKIGDTSSGPTGTFDELRMSLSRQTPLQIRALILLHIRYHYTVMLVTRASLLCEIASRKSSGATSQGVRNSPSPPESPAAGETITSSCLAATAVASATQICSLTLLLDSFTLLRGTSGLDIYYAYSAAMVLLLRILWVRGSSEGDAVAEESKREAREMVEDLRKTVRQAKKSRTMKRFAAVMDKFASAIESIGSDRPSGGQAGPSRFMNTPESGFENNTQRGAIQRYPGPGSNMDVRRGVVPMGSSPNGMSGANFAQPGDWSRAPSNYTSNPHAIPRQQMPRSGRISNLNPSSASSLQHSMYPTPSMQPGLDITPSTLASDSQDAIFGYGDPLDALTNGYIIDWNDLDAFVEGI